MDFKNVSSYFSVIRFEGKDGGGKVRMEIGIILINCGENVLFLKNLSNVRLREFIV